MIINLRCENNDIQSLMFLGAPAEAFGERSDSTSIFTFEYTKTNGLFTAKYESNEKFGAIRELPKQILYRGISLIKRDSDNNFSIDMEALQKLYPIHTIIKKCNAQEMYKYMLSIRNGIDKNLSREDKQKNIKRYKSFLLKISDDQLTPLHAVLKSGDPKKMRVYIEAIKEAYSLEWISKEEYADLLLRKNRRKYTPLHEACRIGNYANLLMCLCEVEKTLDRTLYINLLLGPTEDESVTPLHSVLSSGSVDSLDLYIAHLNELIERKELTKEKYCALLQKRGVNNATPLHAAARSSSEAVVERFLEILKKELPEREYYEALNIPDVHGEIPCGHGYNVNAINKILAEARKEGELARRGNCESSPFSYSDAPKATVFSSAYLPSSPPKQGQNNLASNYARTSY